MAENLKNLREAFQKFGQYWSGLAMVKKIVAVASLLAVLIGVAVALSFSRQDTRAYLYKDLSPGDNQAILAELKKQGVADVVVDSTGIKVPGDQVVPLRLQLAQEGLPSHGQIGWEKFDDQQFTRTKDEIDVNRIRAVQGELARTIKSLADVNSARVHIVMPKKSLFVEEAKKPSAAIYLRVKRGRTMTKRQINGIVHLVSRSVEGLEPSEITIIDHLGKMLTKVEPKDQATKRTQQMLAYRRDIEKEMVERIRGIVGRVVGPDRVEAKVDVEVDFTEEEKTISDIDPDKVVVLSSNTTNQKMTGSGLNPTGIPGAKSNVPGEKEELSLNSSKAQSTRNSERLNYEVAKVKSLKRMPIGTIKRISAAVLVDGKQPYTADGVAPVFEPRTEKEMTQIVQLVRSAIGFKENRDEVIVENMLFQLDPFQVQALDQKKEEKREYISTLTISAVVALALVFFFAFVVRPYFRWLSYDPERKNSEQVREEFNPDLDMGGVKNIQIKEDVPFDKLSMREQILYLAKHEPQRTTEAIRIMLNPHQGG